MAIRVGNERSYTEGFLNRRTQSRVRRDTAAAATGGAATSAFSRNLFGRNNQRRQLRFQGEQAALQREFQAEQAEADRATQRAGMMNQQLLQQSRQRFQATEGQRIRQASALENINRLQMQSLDAANRRREAGNRRQFSADQAEAERAFRGDQAATERAFRAEQGELGAQRQMDLLNQKERNRGAAAEEQRAFDLQRMQQELENSGKLKSQDFRFDERLENLKHRNRMIEQEQRLKYQYPPGSSRRSRSRRRPGEIYYDEEEKRYKQWN